MSAQLAEHLEDKLNESEEEVDSLQRQCDRLQLEVSKSTSHVQQSEAMLAEQATEMLKLRKEVDDLRLERRRLEQELEGERRKTLSPDTCLTPPSGTTFADCALLAEELARLRSNLEQSQACKMRLERQLSDATLEKEGMEQQVARAEEIAEELRLKLAATEDTDRGIVPSSTRLNRSKSMHHSYGGRRRFTTRPPSNSSPLTSPQMLELPPSLLTPGSQSPTSNPSLWSELDSQCATVQSQFDQWVQKCNCSASLEYRKYVKTRQTAEQEGSKEQTQSLLQPFKLMFDELFSSIKETTAVANRLLSNGQEQVETST